MSKNLSCKWFGLSNYQDGLIEQEKYYKQIKQNIKKNLPNQGCFLGFEFNSVITLGIRADKNTIKNKELRLTPNEINKQKIEIVRSKRGGHATLHSPGQLVIYPVLSLEEYGFSVKSFVEFLQIVTTEFLQKLNVKTIKKKGDPGLHTENGKIAFFGLQIKEGISQHGLSINAQNNLKLFSLINSCGVENEKFDSIDNYFVIEKKPDLESLFEQWVCLANEKIIENYKKAY